VRSPSKKKFPLKEETSYEISFTTDYSAPPSPPQQMAMATQ